MADKVINVIRMILLVIVTVCVIISIIQQKFGVPTYIAIALLVVSAIMGAISKAILNSRLRKMREGESEE